LRSGLATAAPARPPSSQAIAQAQSDLNAGMLPEAKQRLEFTDTAL
jgi:hypothetical protein